MKLQTSLGSSIAISGVCKEQRNLIISCFFSPIKNLGPTQVVHTDVIEKESQLRSYYGCGMERPQKVTEFLFNETKLETITSDSILLKL